MNLELIGAGARVRGAFEPYLSGGQGRDLELARVAAAYGESYGIYTAGGESIAEPSGALWHDAGGAAEMPAVGDWVVARMVNREQAIVEAVLPRHSCFYRRAPGRREERQALAANIDLAFLVCALDGDFNLRRLERYLTLAAEASVSPVIVLNKADLCEDAAARAKEAAAISNAPVVTLCARDPAAAAHLEPFLAWGRTVALLGSSGAGKSTIANALAGAELMRTSAVRGWDGRGRHTTTHRELIPLPAGGALIDTPGMRELQLRAGVESVDAAFEEIAALAAHCRFADCSHAGEPECAVAAARASGALPDERWESYRKLRAEARRHEALEDSQTARENKRKLKQRMRAVRQLYRSRGR